MFEKWNQPLFRLNDKKTNFYNFLSIHIFQVNHKAPPKFAKLIKKTLVKENFNAADEL